MSKVGQWVVCLFALPFALGGLWIMSLAIRGTPTGPNGPSIFFWLLFGLIFSGVGFGLIYGTIQGGKILERRSRVQAEHPTEPWLWREDWAAGKVNSKTRGSMIGGWIFAILWNLISIPIPFFVFPLAAKQKNPGAYFILLFPAVGVFLLVSAIRKTIAFLEFGKTYFEMASVPGVVGRELKGQIQARFPHSPDHGVHLRLSCAHRVTTGSGNSQSTRETILWRDDADLSSGQLFPGPNGTTIPVFFRIPFDAQQTEKRGSRDEIVWVLEALAEVPGVDYHDIFEVPVFRTQQTPTEADAETFASFTPVQTSSRPQVTTIQVSDTAQGTEFYFPAARNKSFALSTTMFMLIFGAITYFLMRHAPFIFPLVFGSFSALLWYINLKLWLGTSRVVIGAGEVSVKSGLLGGGRVRVIPLSDVASFNDRITSQQGGATGVPYYDIELTLRDGKKITVGRNVRDKHEAEWLVQQMQRLAGVQAKSAGAGI